MKSWTVVSAETTASASGLTRRKFHGPLCAALCETTALFRLVSAGMLRNDAKRSMRIIRGRDRSGGGSSRLPMPLGRPADPRPHYDSPAGVTFPSLAFVRQTTSLDSSTARSLLPLLARTRLDRSSNLATCPLCSCTPSLAATTVLASRDGRSCGSCWASYCLSACSPSSAGSLGRPGRSTRPTRKLSCSRGETYSPFA